MESLSQLLRRPRQVAEPAGSATLATGQASADEAAPDIPTPVDTARVVTWLKRSGLSHFTDEDGDIALLMRSRLFYVGTIGSREQIVQVRGQWHRYVTIDRLLEALEFCNEWNAKHIWPKAYCRVMDDGFVVINSEFSLDQSSGLTDAQLGQHLACAFSTSNSLFDALEEHWVDPAAVAP